MNAKLLVVAAGQIKVSEQVRKRFDDDDITYLATSIAGVGLQQPVICSQDGDVYRLIDGERRFRACRLLGWTEIPVLVVESEADGAEAIARQLVCNLQRTDLDPIEKAEGIRELMERGSLTGEQVAKQLGLSAADVSRTLTILKLPASVLAKVASGEISADAAYQLSRVADPGEQAALASDVAGKRLTRDGLARKLKRVRRAEDSASAGPTRVTAMLGAGRSITVAAKGLSLDSMVDLLETLAARARKAKANGLTLPTLIRTLKDQAAP